MGRYIVTGASDQQRDLIKKETKKGREETTQKKKSPGLVIARLSEPATEEEGKPFDATTTTDTTPSKMRGKGKVYSTRYAARVGNECSERRSRGWQYISDTT